MTDLLEDFDGAPYPDDVQRAHALVVSRLTSRRVTLEDTGPILEAIAAKSEGEAWPYFDAGRKALVKQQILESILPGLQVFIDRSTPNWRTSDDRMARARVVPRSEGRPQGGVAPAGSAARRAADRPPRPALTHPYTPDLGGWLCVACFRDLPGGQHR
jgi:hypothetical protein